MARPDGQIYDEEEDAAFVVDGEALDGEVLDDLVGEGAMRQPMLSWIALLLLIKC